MTTPIVDGFPFPFEQPMAQELLRVMANLYRTENEALMFVEPFGVDPLTVVRGQSTLNLWYELLTRLATQGTVRAAVKATREKFPNNPRAQLLDALLANQPAPVSATPSAVDGPGFDDSVTEPEALLFFDDLTMPAGKVATLIETLGRLIEIAPSVCLLRVENLTGSFYGTGFRIGASMLLTNYHVLFPKDAVATSVHADFGFDVDAKGKSTTVTSLVAAPATIRGEKADDWAVVTVDGMLPDWPILDIDSQADPQIGDATYILQHPGGQRKRLGYVRNTISFVNAAVVRYLTDTEPGSSGAPVFDHLGRLVALHHAGGRPIEVVGKPPVAKNEGIRISRVRERLAAAGINV